MYDSPLTQDRMVSGTAYDLFRGPRVADWGRSRLKKCMKRGKERQGKTNITNQVCLGPRGIFFEDRVDGCHCSKWVHERWTLRQRAQAAWRSLHAAFAARGFKVKPRSAVTKLTSMVTVTGNGVFILVGVVQRMLQHLSLSGVGACYCCRQAMVAWKSFCWLSRILLWLFASALLRSACAGVACSDRRALVLLHGCKVRDWESFPTMPRESVGGWHHKDGTA